LSPEIVRIEEADAVVRAEGYIVVLKGTGTTAPPGS
jgi:hypothetical protein